MNNKEPVEYQKRYTMESLKCRAGKCLIVAAVSMISVLVGATSQAIERPYSKSSYTLFESSHVRPLSMSADGKYLYVVNTPDNRLGKL